ncbi:MAG: hypothetical protein ACRENK_06550 [Gemmatimonadaceae bacterium]
MTDRDRERQADIPTDTDEVREEKSRSDRAAEKKASEPDSRDKQNPPRTSTGNLTAPKFGSAGSGGAELEPGPERD